MKFTVVVLAILLNARNCFGAAITYVPGFGADNHFASSTISEFGVGTLAKDSQSVTGFLPADLHTVAVSDDSNGDGFASGLAAVTSIDTQSLLALYAWGSARTTGAGNASARGHAGANIRFRIDPTGGEAIGDPTTIYFFFLSAGLRNARVTANAGNGPAIDFVAGGAVPTFARVAHATTIGKTIRMTAAVEAFAGSSGGFRQTDMVIAASTLDAAPPPPTVVDPPFVPEPTSAVAFAFSILLLMTRKPKLLRTRL